MDEWLDYFASVFSLSRSAVASTLLTWAKLLPTVVLLPTVGLQGFPGFLRTGYGLVLALSALPTGASENQFGTELRNLPWCLIQALVTGIPIGIASAVPVWTATMAGGVLDTLGCAGRPEDTGTSTNVVPFSGLFSLLACTLFFETGGPSRVVLLVLSEQTDGILFARLVHHLTSGIGVAIAVVSPVLAASTLGEIIVAVADGIPASGWLRFVLAPFRGLFMLLALGSSLELVTEGLRRWSLHGW